MLHGPTASNLRGRSGRGPAGRPAAGGGPRPPRRTAAGGPPAAPPVAAPRAPPPLPAPPAPPPAAPRPQPGASVHPAHPDIKQEGGAGMQHGHRKTRHKQKSTKNANLHKFCQIENWGKEAKKHVFAPLSLASNGVELGGANQSRCSGVTAIFEHGCPHFG